MWLCDLQLLSVQPACLRSYSDADESCSSSTDNASAAQEQQVHNVQLRLQAVLCSSCSTIEMPAQGAEGTTTTAVPVYVDHQPQQQQLPASEVPSLPLALAAAQLQVLALSRQMQVLHRQQNCLLQLLQQQGRWQDLIRQEGEQQEAAQRELCSQQQWDANCTHRLAGISAAPAK
jgi:hypothetical protein